MKIKKGKEKEYEEMKNKNNDFYGSKVIEYSEGLAELLEEEGKLDWETFEKCNSIMFSSLSITGIMEHFAFEIIFKFWYKGEELLEIFKERIKVENEK